MMRDGSMMSTARKASLSCAEERKKFENSDATIQRTLAREEVNMRQGGFEPPTFAPLPFVWLLTLSSHTKGRRSTPYRLGHWRLDKKGASSLSLRFLPLPSFLFVVCVCVRVCL